MDQNATQREADLALLQRLKLEDPARLQHYNDLFAAEANTEGQEQQSEQYKEAGGDSGAIKRDLEAMVPPTVAYTAAAPVANAIVPNAPLPATVTPSQLGPNLVNATKNLARQIPVATTIAAPAAALMAGQYEKGKGNADTKAGGYLYPGGYGDGYDFQKHGMYLEFPGIDVGRIPYYFNRTMYDMVAKPVADTLTDWKKTANNSKEKYRDHVQGIRN